MIVLCDFWNSKKRGTNSAIGNKLLYLLVVVPMGCIEDEYLVVYRN